jgi:hypothetical protein
MAISGFILLTKAAKELTNTHNDLIPLAERLFFKLWLI